MDSFNVMEEHFFRFACSTVISSLVSNGGSIFNHQLWIDIGTRQDCNESLPNQTLKKRVIYLAYIFRDNH